MFVKYVQVFEIFLEKLPFSGEKNVDFLKNRYTESF